MATLTFAQVLLHTFDKANPQPISLASGKVWRIDSIGIAGANGTVYLRDDSPVPINLAILFSTIDKNDYGATLPFWIPPGFVGSFFNDSAQHCAVSITEYDVAP